MDYPEDVESAKLFARSEDLSRRSKMMSERAAHQSSALDELLKRSAAICEQSDRLCGGPEWVAARAARRVRRPPA